MPSAADDTTIETVDEPLALDDEHVEPVLALPEVEVDDDLLTPPLEGSAESSSLVPYDPYRRYLATIRRYPLLTAEEEKELFRQYQEEGERLAALKLVLSHLGLVVKLANKYRWTGLPIMDLIQEGNIGLMQAVMKFDPTKGARLATYATYWIRAMLIKYLVDNWHLVKTVTTQTHRRLLPKLLRARQKLDAMGMATTPKALAAHLDESEKDVAEAQQILDLRVLSIDTPISVDSDQSMGDLLRDEGPDVDDTVAEVDFQAKLAAVLDRFRATLDDRDRMILDQRLLGDPPATLQHLGDQIGVTREAVRLREKSLKKRLRDYLREHFPEAEFHFQGT